MKTFWIIGWPVLLFYVVLCMANARLCLLENAVIGGTPVPACHNPWFLGPLP